MRYNVDYEQDFYGWLLQQSNLLRQSNFDAIDVEHLANELESMAKRDKRELISRLVVLIAHLLKWQFQAIKQSHSWRNTIVLQREELVDLLQDNPTLRRELPDFLMKAYRRAVRLAENETGIEAKRFPQTCPYTIEQLLDETFFPTD